MKRLRTFLLPLQIIVLLLSPRFGWSIHNMTAEPLLYRGVSFEGGALHCVYQNNVDKADIAYRHPFSKNFTITVNDAEEYSMRVRIDGESAESQTDMLPGIANDIVWEDTFGIMYWRCILTVALTFAGLWMFRRADVLSVDRKLFYAGGAVIYALSVLVSLRVLL